jgi:Raf kinase inhibitor-like YbhB/YbcL family protein
MAKENGELKVESAAFIPNGPIPEKYTCEGNNISPPLKISGIPAGSVSLAIIVDDPDAPSGVFVHWLAWNIDPGLINLPEGADLPSQGKNDFRVNAYNGPCPPPGKPHRYFFKVYALDQKLSLPEGSTKQDLLDAIEGHVLGKGELIGTYQR